MIDRLVLSTRGDLLSRAVQGCSPSDRKPTETQAQACYEFQSLKNRKLWEWGYRFRTPPSLPLRFPRVEVWPSAPAGLGLAAAVSHTP